MTDTQTPPSEPGAALLRAGRFFRPGKPAPDLHSIGLTGGREADAFYRVRWSHDKVVTSTHGVNCTGSCRWKVYVKDGIITWETQQTDYPSVGPDRPEYQDNLFMLALSRGGQSIWMSPQDADAIGVKDDDWIEAVNRNGVVVARAIVSHRMPAGSPV